MAAANGVMADMSLRSLPTSPSLADLREQQATMLDRLRARFLDALDPKDIVPTLVARHILRSDEMGAIYAKKGRTDQVEKLIEILKTKNHWWGPVTDALIRNGKNRLAEEVMTATAASCANGTVKRT
uniref:CARD domain-containing protein n=1 Tax=Plectus sambesii TaxID=2011161 RepID=A0A914X0I7_9BILA